MIYDGRWDSFIEMAPEMFRNVGLFIRVPVGIFLFPESDLELSVSGMSGICPQHDRANKKRSRFPGSPLVEVDFGVRK